MSEVTQDKAKPIYERLDEEPAKWFCRFERYRLMEPGRSINAVYNDEIGTKNDEKERPKAPGKWYQIAKQWQWEARATAWDAVLDEQIEQQIARERKKALRKGYALMHNRVEALGVVAQQLRDYMQDETRVWLADAKIVATGAGESERVDLEVFNDALFKEYREYLTDIAEEMEDRVTPKASMKISSAGPVEFEAEWGGGKLADTEEEEE